MSLTDAQLNALLAPLNPARVQQTQGNSNLEAWDVRRWLLRIFGWGGWDFTVQDCALVSEISEMRRKKDKKGEEYGDPYLAHTVVYRVIGRLTVKDGEGNVLAVFEDGATGDAINQPSLGDAHDFALKTAMSQALKRCAVNLGDQFGLSLYNKGSRQAVVGKSAAHANTEEHAADEQVRGGEEPPPSEPSAEPVSEPAAVSPVREADPEGESEHSPSSPEAVLEELRGRVIEAMNLPKREALPRFARLQAEAAKAKVASLMTTSPGGTPMTLGALIDAALSHVSKPVQGNPHADAAAGEAVPA